VKGAMERMDEALDAEASERIMARVDATAPTTTAA
jgi:hypothetical protein